MMSWIDVCNTGNYPQTNYVIQGVILIVLSYAIVGIIVIIRNTRKRGSSDEIPLCPFPKGIEAGIRCQKLQTIEITRGSVKVCPEPECVYHGSI